MSEVIVTLELYLRHVLANKEVSYHILRWHVFVNTSRDMS